MNSLILAALLTLSPGYNNPGVAGEVVAIEAASTNATAQVVKHETAYALTYTNYDGSAAISTNVLGWVDYDYFKTNGVSKIVKGPTRFDMPITNTVIVATLPKETWQKTNDLASVTILSHFGSVVTNAYLFGDGILVTGAAPGDQIKVLLR